MQEKGIMGTCEMTPELRKVKRAWTGAAVQSVHNAENITKGD